MSAHVLSVLSLLLSGADSLGKRARARIGVDELAPLRAQRAPKVTQLQLRWVLGWADLSEEVLGPLDILLRRHRVPLQCHNGNVYKICFISALHDDQCLEAKNKE